MAKKRPKITADDLQLETSTSKPATTSAPSRNGKRQIAGWFSQAARIQLNQLALEISIQREGRVTVQSLLREALNDLFTKYKKPPIA